MDDLIDFTEQHGAVKAPAQKSTSLSSRLVLQLFSHCFNWQDAPEEIVEFEQLGTLDFFSEGGAANYYYFHEINLREGGGFKKKRFHVRPLNWLK